MLLADIRASVIKGNSFFWYQKAGYKKRVAEITKEYSDNYFVDFIHGDTVSLDKFLKDYNVLSVCK